MIQRACFQPVADGPVPRLCPVSVKAVLRFDQHILLLRQPDGLWELPGGKLEPGEGLTAALVREVREETGLSISTGSVLDTWMREKPGRPPRLVVTLAARAASPLTAEPPIHLSEEHTAFALLPFDQATGLPMLAGYRRTLKAMVHPCRCGR